MQVAKRTQANVTDLARKFKHAQKPAYYDEIVGDVVLNGTLDPNKAKEVIRSRWPPFRCSRRRCRSATSRRPIR